MTALSEAPISRLESLARGFDSIGLGARLRRLAEAAREAGGEAVFTTSFGLEDQALTHAIVDSGAAIRLRTLDTGRLFPETYEVWAETESRYGIRVEVFHPAAEDLARLTAEQGPYGFRESAAARQACCGARKVLPLRRALAGAGIWVTGLRAEQSQARRGGHFVEWDEAHGLIKAAPLLDWPRQRLVDYVALERIPYNRLHDQGFPSIGCQPCTRALRLGEEERAGRWWWEADAKKECGLHVHAAPETAAPASLAARAS
ncbi:phosphoadenylyl-sulfate reductase [Neomegalonema perideroedes]|uniref:phosphoadenylyl-sulfate reductase n=1 Tax=Neomegalonema perideroedes TaxID=217219 RepID=UPI00036008B7